MTALVDFPLYKNAVSTYEKKVGSGPLTVVKLDKSDFDISMSKKVVFCHPSNPWALEMSLLYT